MFCVPILSSSLRRLGKSLSLCCLLLGLTHTVAIAQQTTDLGITISDNQTTTSAGQAISYFVTVVNNGPASVTNMRLVNNLPSAILNPIYTPTRGSYNVATGDWTNFTLAAGESIFMEISGTVSASATGGSMINTAHLYLPSGFIDSNPSNNTCEDRTDIPGGSISVDLGIVKSNNQTSVSAGETISYFLTVVNNGPATVTSFTVLDNKPVQFTATSYTPSEGTYNAATGLWTGVSFEQGRSLFLEIKGTVSAAAVSGTTLLNTAVVLPPAGATDPNSGNNICQDADPITGGGGSTGTVDLGLTKSDNRDTVTPGENLTYTLTVVNNGPSTLSSMRIVDTLPQYFIPPYTYTTRDQNGNTNVGTYNPTTGDWTGINFLPGTSLFLEIKGKVDNGAPSGVLMNMASVSPPAGYTDPVQDNNNCQDKTTIIGQGGADLVLSKTVNNRTPAKGELIQYTLVVTNNGPDVASGVSVSDTLPTGLTFQSVISTSQGSIGSNGTWTVGSLNAGQTASAVIRVQVNENAPSEVRNCAKATSTSNDPDLTSNDACALITPTQPSCSCDAGVESNGDNPVALAQRLVNRTKADGPVANKTGAVMASILNDLVPVVGPQGALPFDQTAAVADLITYGATKAKALYAVDYNLARYTGRRLAGVFAALTEGAHYEHSKVTCDRFGTHTLEDVGILSIANNPFVMSKIIRADGKIDYSVTFTARKIGAGYLVDSRNSTVEYSLPASQTEEVLTFQVWTISPQQTADMVQEILQKLQTKGSVTINNTQWNAPSLPKVFARKGRYENSKLILELSNTSGLRQATITGNMVRVEGGKDIIPVNLTVNLDGKATQTIEIPTNGPIYDATLELTDGTRKGIDQIYFADGTWAYNKPTNVQSFSYEVAPQATYTTKPTEYIVERNAKMSGSLTSELAQNNYISLFRTLRPGGEALDLSKFNAISFTASGQGSFEIVPQKENLLGYQQFRTVADLSSTPKTYTIRFSEFSNGTLAPFTAEDLTWLSFYFLPETKKSYPQNFNIEVKDLKFLANVEDLPKQFILYPNYPNPFNPTTNIEFNVPEATNVRVVVYDIMGREIQVLADRSYRPGLHSVTFDARGYASGMYIYRMYYGETNVLTGRMTLLK